jgi:DNA mismatch endonuclease (patch repair protein)
MTVRVPLTRSQLMSRVHGRGNKSTEEKLVTLLRAAGIKGWRRQLPLPGTPDFGFPKERLAIYVDGCFWHGCPRCYTRPATNQDFWDKKVEDNRARDRRVNGELRSRGWTLMRIWAHTLKNEAAVVRRIQKALRQAKAKRGD